MHARWHLRFANLTLIASGLLLLPTSEGVARQTNGVWRVVDDGTGPNKPPIRKHSTLIYDAGMKRLIMFGGDKSPSGAYSDVWEYPLPCGPWVKLFWDNATDCTSTSRPCRRHGHVATYVPGSPGKMLIHGGKQEDDCVANDTWQLTLGSTPTWTRLWVQPDPDGLPLSRWHSAMVTWGGNALFYGGETLGGACSAGFGIGMCDTWVFSGTQWGWRSGGATLVDPHCDDIPELRYQHSLISDTWNYRIVTFGGVYEGGVGISNTWSSDDGGATWESFGNVPTGYSRALHTATYDPIGKRMIVIGGYAADPPDGIVSAVTSMNLPCVGCPNDGVWSTLNPTGNGPGLIAEHAAAYDPDGDRILVFGGVNQNGTFRNGLWALEFFDGVDVTAPAAVSNLAFTGVTPNSATVRWTAPGDDGATGRACRYDIRYSTSEITGDASFAAATPHTGAPTPALPGTLQSTTIGSLTSGLTYYFAMKTLDESGNASSLSNVIYICIPYTPNTLCDEFKIQPPEGENRVETSFGINDLGPQLASSQLQVNFGLSRSGPVTIEMFDVTGRRVARTDLAELAPGEYTRSLSTGSRLAAGIYVVRLQQGSSATTRRVVLLQQ